MIADLTSLGLPPDVVAERVHTIGGSDANIILSGDEGAILRLWEEKTGRREPEDLKDNLMVMMGCFTEPLNAAWFQKQTGLVVRDRNQYLVCSVDPWRAANLDGRIEDQDAIFEAKHTNPFGKQAEIVRMYMPQLHHNMDVAHVGRAYLSVFRGNSDWLKWEVDYDAEYGAAVHKAEWEFWMAVEADEPPVPYPVPPTPLALSVKEVDMTGDNRWADFAATYMETKVAAKSNATAKEGLKKLVGSDVTRAFGHGLEFNRDKRGALRLTVNGEGEE